MKYFIIALINAIYGVLLLATLRPDTAGFYLVIFIGAVLTILGIIGLILWFSKTVLTPKSADQTTSLKNWFQITKSVDILLVVGLIFRSFVLQPFLVEGNSMEPNFHNQEFLLVDRITYLFRQPKRGEVIVFRYPKNPSEDYIKRIIGMPGDNVKIENGEILINNQLLEENYLQNTIFTNVETRINNNLDVNVGQKEYFVLGDNRNASSDSRVWGMVPRKNIIGRAWFVLYPVQYFGKVANPKFSY